jgi:hypothetical protein
MPTANTIRQWLTESSELSEGYARARQQQADFIAHECIEIADTAKNPNIAKNQIEARKWLASKLAPAKYGDRLDISGTVQVQHDDAASLQTALRLHYILQQIRDRRDAGQVIDVTPDRKLVDTD